MHKVLIRLLIAVSISLTACANRRSARPSPPTVTPVPESPPPISEATPSTSPSPNASPVDSASPTPASWTNCQPNAAFVADITVPDNSHIHPGALFRKTWRIQNNGECPWPEGTHLIFQEGEDLGAPHRIPLTSIAPDRMVDASIEMQAPLNPGTYRGYWRLKSPGGEIFGAVLYVQIVVTDMPILLTAVATPTPQSTTAPTTPTLIPPTQTPHLATPTPSPTSGPDTTTVEPTETAEAEPVPTPPTCLAPDPMFVSVLHQAEILGIGLRCATGPTTQNPGKLQFYRANLDQSSAHEHHHSLMLYNAHTDLVYAFEGKDPNIYEANIEIYRNRWDETQPEIAPACAALAPPTGYQMPVRQIGKAWCGDSLWLRLGWPQEPAMDGTFTLQETTHGLLMKVEPEASSTNPLLIAVDMETYQATTLSTP